MLKGRDGRPRSPGKTFVEDFDDLHGRSGTSSWLTARPASNNEGKQSKDKARTRLVSAIQA